MPHHAAEGLFFGDFRNDLVKFGVDVVGVVDEDGFGDHGRLGGAPFGKSLVGDDDVLESQELVVVDIDLGGRLADEVTSLEDVADELDGLPPQKMHCSNLGADALHAAIEDYWVKTGKIRPEDVKHKQEREGEEGESCGT